LRQRGFPVFVAAPKIAVRLDGVMAADAIGLGVFAAIGAASAEAHSAGFVTIMFMAVRTACRVVRGVPLLEIPAILKKRFPRDCGADRRRVLCRSQRSGLKR
jgi:uncharacterized membrane protein YeiH